MLIHCEDFKQQRDQCRLKELIEGATTPTGDKFVLLPKYHCELAPVERCWARVKWWLRARCNYDIKALRAQIGGALEQCNVDLVRKYFNLSFYIMGLYAEGHNLQEATKLLQAHHKLKKQQKREAAKHLKRHQDKTFVRHRPVCDEVDRIILSPNDFLG